LLDAMLDQPLQTWSFSDETLIRVGRSLDNEIVIDNPVVSRSHVYLKYQEGRWELSSLSTKGIEVEGRQTMQSDLRDGQVFRLGEQGPRIRFFVTHEAGDARETYAAAPAQAPVFQLDEAHKAGEVQAITSTPFFQRLRAAADRFRRDEEA
jgi:serine/threonine-protein kinase